MPLLKEDPIIKYIYHIADVAVDAYQPYLKLHPNQAFKDKNDRDDHRFSLYYCKRGRSIDHQFRTNKCSFRFEIHYITYRTGMRAPRYDVMFDFEVCTDGYVRSKAHYNLDYAHFAIPRWNRKFSQKDVFTLLGRLKSASGSVGKNADLIVSSMHYNEDNAREFAADFAAKYSKLAGESIEHWAAEDRGRMRCIEFMGKDDLWDALKPLQDDGKIAPYDDIFPQPELTEEERKLNDELNEELSKLYF